ncbi:hypothetical protein RRG08_060009 [Elysia crispata]|uniref:Uncharacterized protein n=1 Tax=Elysia crispata TaxID=231223 RepID=A0AAE0YEE7_9GAST|nr:hypothetical protein RRG08_060009 [Elysia crispata]
MGNALAINNAWSGVPLIEQVDTVAMKKDARNESNKKQVQCPVDPSLLDMSPRSDSVCFTERPATALVGLALELSNKSTNNSVWQIETFPGFAKRNPVVARA